MKHKHSYNVIYLINFNEVSDDDLTKQRFILPHEQKKKKRKKKKERIFLAIFKIVCLTNMYLENWGEEATRT